MKTEKIIPSPESINKVFSIMALKLNILHSDYRTNKLQRNEIVKQLIEYNEEIRNQYLREWHTVEAQLKIIEKLEYYLNVFGHDVDSIINKISEEKEIKEHLEKAMNNEKNSHSN